MFGLSGDRELKKQMEKLSKAVNNRISKKALGVGTKIVAKAIKKQIPNSQKSARKAIGASVQRPKKGAWKGWTFAKAGAGVGMKKEKRQRKSAEAKFNRKSKRKGVGIGVSNIMWLLEGTDKRYTGTKRVGAHKRGNKKRVDTGKPKKYTGRMRKSGYVQKAERETRSQVSQAIRGEVMKGIQREMAKA
jgi:hypothetical protein